MKAKDPDALCRRYLAQIERLYGHERMAASRCWNNRGWYYVNVARVWPDGSVWEGGVHVVRRSKLEEMIATLEKRKAKQ